MSAYTLMGSEALDAQIEKHLNKIIETVSPLTDTVILTGGYGRGDGTPFIHPDGSQSPFNDYDLVVIVDRLDEPLQESLSAIETQLTEELGITVDLCPYVRSRLPRAEFSLLNYEMKYGHKVLRGDKQILDAMPGYNPQELPLTEGTRLLLNRGKLLLDIRLRMADPQPLSEEERIRFIKFFSKVWLAMGDCILLSEGKYDISYDVKRKRIVSTGAYPHRDVVVDQYLKAIELRNWGDYHARLQAADIPGEFRRARTTFLDYLAWYRKMHSARECSFLKAMLLNLKWNRWPYLSHPRARLYDALPELLQDRPDHILLGQILSRSGDFKKRFYELQKRFS